MGGNLRGADKNNSSSPSPPFSPLWSGRQQDNLNTHSIASLYEAFDPKEARRLAERLDIHYTPKHGSWLNMAEIELSVLKGQCLGRRIDNMETMKTEVVAWEQDRNNSLKKINWQFTTSDARIKLTRLYPKL